MLDPAAMFRFLHTADWQLGMEVRSAGPAADRVRAARLEALEALLTLAAEREAAAVLAAGDQFEHNQVDPALVERAAGLLRDKAPCPVYLIPGNHDPYSRDSVYRRPLWKTLQPKVRVLAEPTPTPLADGVTLYPCPLARKSGFDDPTRWIPPREAGDDLRIGLAHGSLDLGEQIAGEGFPIPPDAAERRELDYLALGHWHGRLACPDAPDARTWYPGTHEPTDFGQRRGGSALLVTLDEPGAPPTVEPVATGVLTWRTETVDLGIEPLGELIARLRNDEQADRTLLRLSLRGRAPADYPAGRAELADLLEARYLRGQIDDSLVVPPEADALLAEMPAAAHVRSAVEELEALAGGSDPSAAEPEVARRALEILTEAAWAARSEGEGAQ